MDDHETVRHYISKNHLWPNGRLRGGAGGRKESRGRGHFVFRVQVVGVGLLQRRGGGGRDFIVAGLLQDSGQLAYLEDRSIFSHQIFTWLIAPNSRYMTGGI